MITKRFIFHLFFTLFTFLRCPFFSFGQTACTNGTAATFPCNNITLMSSMSLQELGASSANDIWGWTSPNTNKEYAIIGLNNGYAFVDISDPSTPIKIGNLPTSSGNSDWGDVKVNDNYAYLVSEASGHHIQVFDLLQLDGIDNPPIIFDDEHYSLVTIGNGNCHNIVIDEESNFAYSVGTRSLCSGGLVAFDLSNPANPSFAGCFSADGYSHDAVCFVYRGIDTEHIGKQICIGFNENTYTIVDMTDKTNPIQIARAGYGNVRYTHQGWITDDHRYLLLNDEGDERGAGVNTSTYIFNLSDLDNPSYIDTYTGSSTSIDHNLYVKGSYVYEANYAEGLRILDITDIANGNLNEVAYFDFYPSHNNASFISVWSSYPYFKSGNVVVSDFEEGLYVVQPQLPHFVMTLSSLGVQNVCTSQDAVFEIDLSAYAGFSNLVSLNVTGLPTGATATFSNNNPNPNGNTRLTISNLDEAGKYSLLVTATASGSLNQKIALGLIVEGSTPTPILELPENGATAVSTSPELTWSVPFGSSIYDVEVATDAAFNQVVFTQNQIDGLSFMVPNLAAQTTYYWRVRGATSPCSPNAPWSTTFSFLTENIVQTTVASQDIPISISSTGMSTITSTINIATTGIISDINMTNLEIQHTYIGDLVVTLRSPSGTEITLLDRPGEPSSNSGCRQNNILVDFDDAAILDYHTLEGTCNTSNSSTTYAIEGSFQSMQALSAFHGEEMQGDWVLSISDAYSRNGGSLESWSLELFSSDIALPIAFLNFDAVAQKNSIVLAWSLENNPTIKHFVLERRHAAIDDFERIADFDAAHRTIFNYEDKAVKAGIRYYYRLRYENEAGKESFSKVVAANLPSNATFQLLPNPTRHKVQLIINSLEKAEQVRITLFSLDGKLLTQKEVVPLENVYWLDLKGLAKGVYWVKVQRAKSIGVERLIIN